ncbi:MAG: hypothetical protein ACXWEA_05390 [Solirubrobacterales bacterium]
MKRTFKRIRMPRAGVVLGVIALVAALTGTAVAAKTLKIGMFDDSSRNRLAGTGVIQYAANAQTTGDADVPATPPATSPAPKVQTFSVKCELSKKATSGGFKWTGATPPLPTDYELLDAYPNGGGYVVRMYILGPTAAKQPLTVYSNCVKSRRQNGTPPA